MQDTEIIKIFQDILDEQKKQTEIIKKQSSDTKMIRIVAWIFLVFYILLPIIFSLFGISILGFLVSRLF